MSSKSFPQFSLLPPELQARVWEVALDDAIPENRMLTVSVYHRLHVSHHSCVTLGGDDAKFCGDITQCASYSDGQRSHISMFMTDGFFSTSDDFPEPDDPITEEAIRRFSLTCIEARGAVTRRFPISMRVHRGFFQVAKDGDDAFWFQTRFVRCHPARDWLLITQVPDMSVSHTTSRWNGIANAERHQMLDSIFPNNASFFAEFRRILSSFERFAFAYMGDNRPEHGDESHDAEELIGMDMPATSDFNTLLLFLESRTSLFMWPHPKYWQEVREEGTRMIPDVLALGAFGRFPRVWEFRSLMGEMEHAMRDYKASVRVHRVHSAPSDKYWVPMPKRMRYIGCFAASRWIRELGWHNSSELDSGTDSYVSEDDSASDSSGDLGGGVVKWMDVI